MTLHASHDFQQDDDGITACTRCECYPYNKEAREPCAPWPGE